MYVHIGNHHALHGVTRSGGVWEIHMYLSSLGASGVGETGEGEAPPKKNFLSIRNCTIPFCILEAFS